MSRPLPKNGHVDVAKMGQHRPPDPRQEGPSIRKNGAGIRPKSDLMLRCFPGALRNSSRSSRGRPYRRFWSHFGSPKSSILDPFWTPKSLIPLRSPIGFPTGSPTGYPQDHLWDPLQDTLQDAGYRISYRMLDDLQQDPLQGSLRIPYRFLSRISYRIIYRIPYRLPPSSPE